MIEERLNILEKVISAVGFDRLNLHLKKDLYYNLDWDIECFGANQLEQVLNRLQLPFYFFDWRIYDQIIEKETIVLDDIKAFIKLIKHRRKAYLTNVTKRDLYFIKKATELQWNFELLSEKLSFDLSKKNLPYYWFIHYEKLRKELITPQNFLEDIRLAEKINLMTNISLHKIYVDNIYEHSINKIISDATIIDAHHKMNFLFEFIAFDRFEKYEKVIKLIEIL